MCGRILRIGGRILQVHDLLMSMYILEYGDEQQDVGQWGRTEEH